MSEVKFEDLTGSKILHLTEAQKAYIAGIVDGEGCISASKRSLSSGRRGFTLILQVVNTDRNLLDYIVSILGLGKVNYPKRLGAHKQQYRLSLFGCNAKVVISEISPYLIVKREQAIVALSFDVGRSYRKGMNYTRLPDDALRNQQKSCAKLHILNKRGDVQ